MYYHSMYMYTIYILDLTESFSSFFFICAILQLLKNYYMKTCLLISDSAQHSQLQNLLSTVLVVLSITKVTMVDIPTDHVLAQINRDTFSLKETKVTFQREKEGFEIWKCTNGNEDLFEVKVKPEYVDKLRKTFVWLFTVDVLDEPDLLKQMNFGSSQEAVFLELFAVLP